MLDLSTFCRTCMKDNVPLVDLYEPVKIEENCFQLAEILVLCTSTEVLKEDALPQKLCSECVKTLQVSYAFRTQAERSQEEFKKLLEKEIKSEPIEIELKTECEDDDNTVDDNSITEDFPKIDFEEKCHSCRICNKTFTKENKLLKHLETHESSLQCPICKKLCHSQSSLDRHLSKHVKYTCLVCKLEFFTEEQLLSHSTEHTLIGGEPSKLQCPECDLTFLNRRALSMHRRKHKDQKPKPKEEVSCDTCDKVFSRKHQLKRHMLLHNDVKPHKCEKCSKTFARKDQLTSHMHTHKSRKPYECSY